MFAYLNKMRFYKKELPNVDEIVMCNVEKIQEECIYVRLIEYDNIEGMVQLADASTRRKRKSVCLLKVNKKYPLLVVRIDEEKKYIDLSNKFLSDEDRDVATDRHHKYSFTVKMLKSFISKINNNKYEKSLLTHYADKTLWKVEPRKCYEYIIENYIQQKNFDLFDLTEEEKEIFRLSLEKSLGDVLFKSQLNFMARNTNFEGVHSLKNSFEKIKNEFSLTTMINVAPNYYVQIESDSENLNLETLSKLESVLEKELLKNNCLYKKIDIVTTNNLD